MLDAKAAAAARIGEKLKKAEAAIDEAIRCTADLAGDLPVAWSEARLSIVVAPGAFERTGQMLAGLMQVRQQGAEAHRILDATREKIGVPSFAWGDKPALPTGEAIPALKVVAG